MTGVSNEHLYSVTGGEPEGSLGRGGHGHFYTLRREGGRGRERERGLGSG